MNQAELTALATKQDLAELKHFFSDLITKTVKPHKTWMRGSEIKEHFSISESTLKNWRINGLPYSKAFGTILYDISAIEEMLVKNKVSIDK